MLIVDITEYIPHNMPTLWPIQNFSKKIAVFLPVGTHAVSDSPIETDSQIPW